MTDVTPADEAALSDTERQFLTFALDLAADQMASRGNEFEDQDRAALEKLRRMADEAQQSETQAEVVHACPPDGSGITPCCGRTPFELPRTDRMSVDSTLITCQPAAVSQPGKEA